MHEQEQMSAHDRWRRWNQLTRHVKKKEKKKTKRDRGAQTLVSLLIVSPPIVRSFESNWLANFWCSIAYNKHTYTYFPWHLITIIILSKWIKQSSHSFVCRIFSLFACLFHLPKFCCGNLNHAYTIYIQHTSQTHISVSHLLLLRLFFFCFISILFYCVTHKNRRKMPMNLSHVLIMLALLPIFRLMRLWFLKSRPKRHDSYVMCSWLACRVSLVICH